MALLLKTFSLQSKQNLFLVKCLSTTAIRCIYRDVPYYNRSVAKSDGPKEVGEAKPLGGDKKINIF